MLERRFRPEILAKLQRTMRYQKLHSWDVTTAEAERIQEFLRGRVKLEDDFRQIKVVAGVDVGYSPSDGTATGGVVALTFPGLELIESSTATECVTFPYVPGLLSFREAPAVLAALEQLKATPDLLMVDGQGYAHRRRFGIACHLGLLLDRPSIGCAKSRLIGEYAEPGLEPGDSSPLLDGTELLGSVVRTRQNVKPMFISPGHRVSFQTAERLVLQCIRSCRLPEPTMLADKLVSRARPRPFDYL